MKKYVWFLTLMLPLSCYSANQQWYNPNISDDEAQRKFSVDRGECTAQAYQAIQVPSSPQPRQQNSATKFSGYSERGGVFSGQIQSNQAPPDLAEGLQEYRGRVLALQQIEEARSAQRDIATGCMSSRGWELR